MEFHARQ